MAQQTINIGASPNDGTGTPLRTAFQYTNSNFSELYTALGGGSGLPGSSGQVIFNDGGTNLAGDTGLTFNKTTDTLGTGRLTTSGDAIVCSSTGDFYVGTTLSPQFKVERATGAATITGDLTVDTSTLKVDSANHRVGVGTTSPNSRFVVSGGRTGLFSGDAFSLALGQTTGQANYLYLGTDASGTLLVSESSGNSVMTLSQSGVCTWLDGAGGTRMTLNSTGLGVGDTPASNTRLTVAAASRLADTTGQAYIHSTDAQAQDIGAQLTLGGLYNASAHYAFGGIAGRKENSTSGNVAGYLDFLTTTSAGALTSRMRIDSTGNVGIGVTPSAWISSWKAIDINTDGAGLVGTAAITNLTNNCFLNASAQWIYKGSFVASRYQQSGGEHQFYTAASGTAGNAITFTQAMTLDSAGRLLVGPTSANTSGGVLQLSSGITFPATQVASSDANTLDDYEEGTWTATLKGSVSDPTTPVTATGRYTKIGRQVSIQLFVNNVTTTGASGRIQIDGLPFANNGSVEAISNVGFYNMATFTGVPFGLTSASSTVVDMWSSVSAGVFQAVNYNPGSVQYVWVNLTYTV